MVVSHDLILAAAARARRVAGYALRLALAWVALMGMPSAAAGQPATGSSGQPDASQEPPPPAAQEQPPPPTQEQPPPPTSDDRLFWTLPNFLTVQNGGFRRPLTFGEKYDVVFRTTFDYIELAWYGVQAGIAQSQNSIPTEGHGLPGFAKRFGTAFGDGSIDNFMVGAVFPSILKQDPRYFQLGEGAAWHREGYAVSRLLVTRSDRGRPQLNVSELLGTAATAGLATVYRPPADRTLKTVASVWLTQVAYDGLAVSVKEFWPDIRRKLTHR